MEKSFKRHAQYSVPLSEGGTDIIGTQSGDLALFSRHKTGGLTNPHCQGVPGWMEAKAAVGDGHEELIEYLNLMANRNVVVLHPLLDDRAHHGS